MNTMRRRPREPEDGSDLIGIAIGVFGALALSVAMLPLRDHLHNDNMALALVLPVLIAAVLGGRLAGAAAPSRRRSASTSSSPSPTSHCASRATTTSRASSCSSSSP